LLTIKYSDKTHEETKDNLDKIFTGSIYVDMGDKEVIPIRELQNSPMSTKIGRNKVR